MEDHSLLENLRQHLAAKKGAESMPPGHSRHQIINKTIKRVLVHNTPFLFTTGADDHIQTLRDHSIIIENDTIREVLPAKEVKFVIPAPPLARGGGIQTEGFDLIYDAGKRGGVIITPGLINTHAHCHMYLMRGVMMLDEGEGVDETIASMAAWLSGETDSNLALAAIGDITEQQKSGITTTLSHGPSFIALEAAARATGHTVINAVSVVSHSRPTNTIAAAAKILSDRKNYKSIPAIAIHYLYKASLPILEEVRSLIEQYDALLTFHMAESPQVAAETKKTHGLSETALLAKVGLLNGSALASHVLYVDDPDIAKLAESKIGIAHLPTSNVIHKSGIFPLWKFADLGGFPYISLGTDSVVSKSRLDILSEAYQTRLSHLYARTVKFSSLFKMMTANGGRVLGEKRGKILPGYFADIAFWKLKDRGTVPYDEANPITLIGNLITHGGRFVRDLMIDGRFVIKDRRHQLIDESKLLAELQKAHMQMRERVLSRHPDPAFKPTV